MNLIRTTLFAIVAVGVSAVAQAQTERLKVDIPAQPMRAALADLGRQTGLQILYREADIERLGATVTEPVTGELSARDVVERMLARTGLKYQFVNERTVRIASTLDPISSASPSPSQGEGIRRTDEDLAKNMRLAESPSPSQGEGQGEDKKQTTDTESESARRAIPEILVKGSRGGGSLNAEIERSEDDVQPYVVIRSEDIERSGATDIQHLIAAKMPAAAPTALSQTSNSALGNSTQFNLRGLGAGQTLVLVNGRRIASSNLSGTRNQGDLGGVPLSAVERVEILPSTASGIFGGGATGGVINVILKQKYSGLDASASLENTFRATAPDRRVNLSGGFTSASGKTNAMIMGSFTEASPLYTDERDFLTESRKLLLRNNPSAINGASSPPLGATSNIRGTTGVLRLKPAFGGAVLPANFTYVPYGYAGASSDNGAGLVANAGKYNLDPAATAQGSGGGRQALVNAPTIKSASGTIRHQFRDNLEGFLDLAVAQNEGSYVTNANSFTYTLGANAAANPFVQSVLVTTPAFGLDTENTSKITNRRAVIGLNAALGAGWHIEAEYSWNRSRFYVDTGLSQFPAPGNTEVNAGTINIMRDENVFPADFSAYARSNSKFGPGTTTLENPSLRIGGLIPINLPGGKPSLSFTTEYRREELGDSYVVLPTGSTTYYPSRRQATTSAYLESRIPVVSALNRFQGVDLLELQLALRNDWYTTVAANSISLRTASPASVQRQRSSLSSADPTVGMKYAPLKGITFRGSFATGFVPPDVSQLVPGVGNPITFTPASGLVDPLRGNQAVTGVVLITSGGNPNLLPEQAKSWTVGLILEPSFAHGLRLSVDRTKIAKRNNIGALSGQDVINGEMLVPGIVDRDIATPQNDPQGYGVGPIKGLSSKLINIASNDIEALDLALDYHWATGRAGDLDFSVNATRMVHNKSTLVPTSPTVERVGTTGFLGWMGNAALTWEFSDWSVSWQSQYYEDYTVCAPSSSAAVCAGNVLNQGSYSIPSQIYHDLTIGYRPTSSSFLGGRLSGAYVQLGVKNVFDHSPPIVVSDPNGYSKIGDPRMARYYFSVRMSF